MVGGGKIERNTASLEGHQKQLVRRVTLKGRESAIALIHRHATIKFDDSNLCTEFYTHMHARTQPMMEMQHGDAASRQQ
jgi:hypothetical protein|eukprot:COSAG02_NODE_1678_length_11359_cov_7.398224_3_plen_79_part_00